MAIIPLLITVEARAEDLIAPGKYKSLDGDLDHSFSKTGDYLGKVTTNGKVYSYPGLYREGEGLCWLPQNDGGKVSGNLVLYYGEVQCCLRLEGISDKIAVTYIWSKPYAMQAGLCANQVLQRIKSND